MRRDNTDLVVVAGLGSAAALGQLLTAPLPDSNPLTITLRVLTGIPLALLLPGYALSLLLLPGKESRGMPLLRRAMWTVGGSLVVTVLGGLVLNVTPIGLSRPGWTILLTAVTVAAAAGTAVDRRRRPIRPTPRAAPWRAVTVRTASYGLGAVVATTAAVWLAYAGAAAQAQPDFTQLWLVPTQAGTATVGVRNDNPGTEQFALNLTSGTQAPVNWLFTLRAGQSWQLDVPVTTGQPLQATLSRPGQAGAPQVVVLRPLPSSTTTPAPPS